jgi:hypothetical protein
VVELRLVLTPTSRPVEDAFPDHEVVNLLFLSKIGS